jgi:hypothetical protein
MAVKGKAKLQKLHLRVAEDGKRRYISVPMERASDLHAYLRSNRVSSAPPEPAYTGTDYIELPKGVDVGSVQTLLDAWSGQPAVR